jgi:hypothetical protein
MFIAKIIYLSIYIYLYVLKFNLYTESWIYFGNKKKYLLCIHNLEFLFIIINKVNKAFIPKNIIQYFKIILYASL